MMGISGDAPRVAPEVEPGSFRDFDSRVFVSADGVFRALSAAALKDFEGLAATRFFATAQASGRVVQTRRAENLELPPGAEPAAGCRAVLEHERVPFVSWPYEWSFSMLKDAAISQLELLRDALAEGFILKDGTPYNTQWQGARPTFIDIGSFEQLREGEPWFGYRQFCMQFLYPLMLQSLRGVSYRPFLRGKLDGIAPEEMRRLLPRRDRLRRAVFIHVVLHARFERRHASESARRARSELKRAGFRREMLESNVRQIVRAIRRLRWESEGSEWSRYAESHTYSEAAMRFKQEFVMQAAARVKPNLAWDLGCNDGRFTHVVARHARYVVAIDADELAMDRLYRDLRDSGEKRILPLTMDLVDASPGLGWRGVERRRLEERGRPDLVLALALIHHVTIGANVPVADFVNWLADLNTAVVIEFPARDDQMVRRLLDRKRPGAHPDYKADAFEAELERRMQIRRREQHGTRALYEADPR